MSDRVTRSCISAPVMLRDREIMSSVDTENFQIATALNTGERCWLHDMPPRRLPLKITSHDFPQFAFDSLPYNVASATLTIR